MTRPNLDVLSAQARFSSQKKAVVLLLALLALCGVAFGAILLGAYRLTGLLTLRVLLGESSVADSVAHTIIWEIRLPRILLAIASGMALSAAGTAYQSCFRNPLVEPYILGVSAGAAFGAALGIVFPKFWLSIQLLAFLGGSTAVFSAYVLARRRGETSVIALVLSGVIIGSVGTALVSILKYLANDAALREIVFWYMGGFYHANWKDVQVVVPITLLGFALIWRWSWQLNVLSMGDEEARSLGVHPERYKTLLVMLATLITALSVSACGIIAWVGLMTPHAARMLIGPDQRFAAPLAAIMGAIYLLICDTLARSLTSAEIPVGIITSILGAPYLLYLLRKGL